MTETCSFGASRGPCKISCPPLRVKLIGAFRDSSTQLTVPAPKSGQHEPSRAAPIEYVQVDSAGFLGGAAPDQALQGTRISAVDGFTVRVHPLAQLLQALDAWFGYSAFSIGSYIQQIVPAFC